MKKSELIQVYMYAYRDGIRYVMSLLRHDCPRPLSREEILENAFIEIERKEIDLIQNPNGLMKLLLEEKCENEELKK